MCVLFFPTLRWREDDEGRCRGDLGEQADPPTTLHWGEKNPMHFLHGLTDKARRAEYINKYICTFKKRAMNKRNLELIFFFSCLLGMGLEWAAVRVGAVWGQEMVRREEISEKLTLLVSFYIKMQMAFYLNLALCFSQCL